MGACVPTVLITRGGGGEQIQLIILLIPQAKVLNCPRSLSMDRPFQSTQRITGMQTLQLELLGLSRIDAE